MEEDFPTSPSKRQRTMSPEDLQTSIAGVSTYAVSSPHVNPSTAVPVQETPTELPGFLDVLMEQVEAESAPSAVPDMGDEDPQTTSVLQEPILAVCPPRPLEEDPSLEGPPAEAFEGDQTAQSGDSGRDEVQVIGHPEAGRSLEEDTYQLQSSAGSPSVAATAAAITSAAAQSQATGPERSAVHVEGDAQVTIDDSMLKSHPAGISSETITVPDLAQAVAEIDGVALVRGQAQSTKGPELTASNEPPAEAREWETDSSFDDSSSDSSSSTDSDDSSDNDADGDYAMLDPEEQARILMQGDGGSDDEGGKSNDKANAGVRTINEKVEEIIPKPDIQVTEDMQMEALGTVEATVESNVVIKARTSGEYQVLESGSLLCLKDRSVIGVIAETMGRVEQPMYTVRFTNDQAIAEAGVSEKGTMIYYVVPHSTFVFTQPLKGIKGSDASNLHDEEVGEHEMEFSDDEKEAEYKKQLKLRRQGRLGRDDATQSRGGRGRGRGRGRGDYRDSNLRHSSISSQTEPNPADDTNGGLNYDDEPDDYTPLRRPDAEQKSPPRSSIDRDRGESSYNRGRADGFHGHRGGRGDRGGFRGRGRGRGRGSYDNYNHQPQTQYDNRTSYPPNQNQYQQAPNQQFYQTDQQQMPPPPPLFNTEQQQHPFQAQQTPQLTPQHPPPFAAFSPSPISPLPGQQLNLGQFQGFPPPPPPPPGMFARQGGQVSAEVRAQLEALMRMQVQNSGGGGGAPGQGPNY